MRLNTETVTAFVAAMAFVFAVAGVFGSWRVSKNTTALTAYRDTAQAWEGKARAQEAEIADLQADAHLKDKKIAELEGKVAVLQDSLTGKASWDILERRISEALSLASDNRKDIQEILALTRNR